MAWATVVPIFYLLVFAAQLGLLWRLYVHQRQSLHGVQILQALEQQLVGVCAELRRDLATHQQTQERAALASRTLLGQQIKDVSAASLQALGVMGRGQNEQLARIAEQFAAQQQVSEAAARATRGELVGAFDRLGGQLRQAGEQTGQQQGRALQQVVAAIAELTAQNERRGEALKHTVEARLDALRRENEQKLEQMRQTVDEKLQGTLEQRLGASFTLVNQNLERVFKSVGEMQTIATGVGDLKRVLANVKTRGTWGETALGALLEQTLTPEQFGRNVEVVPNSNQRVEYALRLPQDGLAPLWLPLDAKLPSEDYARLSEAAERGDSVAVEEAARALERAVRIAAKDIAQKYIGPPHTTDFAVMFLPTEGLFAEVVRRPGLIDGLQRDHRIVVTGPTTLGALLNALRMGFRTLAIQKRSSEVWEVLGAVKTEFGKFGGVLDTVSKKLEQASKVVNEAGVRRRAVDRRLQDVEAVGEARADVLLQLTATVSDGQGAAETTAPTLRPELASASHADVAPSAEKAN